MTASNSIGLWIVAFIVGAALVAGAIGWAIGLFLL
jgi:hypothetical protein